MKITFLDSGREPRCAPNPAYPNGIDVDLSSGGKYCIAALPYPAPRCGAMVIECERCGLRNAVTVAGRPDDPRTVKMGCKMLEKTAYRAVLIDPERCTIKETRLAASVDAIRQIIAPPDDEGIDHFLYAEHDHSWDQGWVRDCGLLRGEPIHAVKFWGRHDPVAGRIVLVGVDRATRDTCDAVVPIDFLRHHTEWLGLIKPEVIWVEEANGSRAVVIYERVR